LALAFLAIAIGALSSYAYLRYPGMTVRMWEYSRTNTLPEQHNLFQTLTYWVRYMEMLELDEETSLYHFPPVPDGASGVEACTLRFHRGEFSTAAACLDQEIEASGPSEEKLFWLGVALMRQAEAENCLEHLLASEEPEKSEGSPFALESHQHQRFCTLPLEAQHQRKDLARRAAATFQRLLDDYDADDRLYRWLLNFNLMTVGGFPEEVPERYRIDSPFIDAFYGAERREKEARYSHLRFVDRAAELGIDTHDTGRGVVVEDFDGDGYLDIVTGGAFHLLHYYRNVGGTSFEELTEEAGLGGVTQPFIMSGADYDNDGWIDLFVARPFDRYMLFRNVRGSFVEVTEETGLLGVKGEDEVAASWVSTWGDIDLDGDLDLFLAQWGMELPLVKGLLDKPRMDSKLFLNVVGRFEDVTEAWGLAQLVRDQYYVGASFGDSDNDGDLDLFLSSPAGQASVLLENHGPPRVGGSLEQRGFAPADRLDREEHGFFTTFLDVNHDGLQDIFQGGFSDARTSTEMTVFGENLERYQSGHSTILLQNHQGRFEERNDFFTGNMPMATMGVNYGDLDLDGCLDFYLGTGNPESWFVLPNQMYMGEREGRRCTGRMDNISMLQGFGTIQKGHSPVFFDFDEDGDQDVYSSLGGMWPMDAWPNQMFVNESDLGGAAWVKLRLRGRQTNHFGLGARVVIEATAPDGSIIYRRFHMDNKTGFGSAPYLAHIGLLDATEIRGIEVYWPVSRCLQIYSATLNQLNVLDEAHCR